MGVDRCGGVMGLNRERVDPMLGRAGQGSENPVSRDRSKGRAAWAPGFYRER